MTFLDQGATVLPRIDVDDDDRSPDQKAFDDVFQAPARDAQAQFQVNSGENPDEAAKVLKISNDLKVPPGAVKDNTEQYEQYQDWLAGGKLIEGNPYIQQYLNANPTHAAISKDDLHNLDQLSESWLSLKHLQSTMGPYWDFFEGFARGFAPRPITGDVNWAEDFKYKPATFVGDLGVFGVELGVRSFNGILEGARQSAENFGKKAGMSDAYAAKFGRDVATFTQLEMLSKGTVPEATAGALAAEAARPGYAGLSWLQTLFGARKPKPGAPEMWTPDTVDMMRRGGQWYAEGYDPPIGFSAITDQRLKESAKEESQAIQQVGKDYDATETAQRSPEAIDNFVSGHPNAVVRLTSDGLKQVYADYLGEGPRPGDGKLGDLDMRGFDTAIASGTHVDIPLEDWLKLKPELRDELKDHTFLRPTGLSPAQAKEPALFKEREAEEPKEIAAEGAEPERITGAAIRMNDGRVFTGVHHVDAMDNAMKALGKRDIIDDVAAGEDGMGLFVTSTGRLVDREEAGKIATASEQAAPTDRLRAHDIHEPLKNEVMPAIEPTEILPPERLPTVEESVEQSIATNFEDVKDEVGRPFDPSLLPSVEVLQAKEAKGVVSGPPKRKPAKPKPATPEELEATAQLAKDYKSWKKLITKEDDEGKAFLKMVAETRIRKTKTKEWQDEALAIREDGINAIDTRPDVKLAKLILKNELPNGGEGKRGQRPALDEAHLTAQQMQGLHQDMTRPFGAVGRHVIKPDDLAPLLGFNSGKELVASLIETHAIMKANGWEGKRGFDKWRDKLIEYEIDRRLEAKFGPLEEGIIEELHSQMYTPTALERHYEEVKMMAREAGQTFPELGNYKTLVEALFNKAPVGQHSSRKYLRNAGIHNRRVERNLRAGKFTEAYFDKMQEINSLHLAKFSADLEKVQKRLERYYDQYGKVRKDDDRLTAAHRNFIHQIFDRAGYPTGWRGDQLAREIAKGEHKTLQDFVQHQASWGSRMDIWGTLTDTVDKIKPQSLLPPEFKDFVASIGDMIADGRMGKEMYLLGKWINLAEMRMEFEQEFNKFERLPDPGMQRDIKPTRGMYASLITLQNLFNRIDLRNPRGPFNRLLSFPLARAEARLHSILDEIEASVKDLTEKYPANLQERIPNNFILNPMEATWPIAEGVPPDFSNATPIPITREGLRALLTFWGEKTAREKMLRGWNVTEQQMQMWFEANATEGDIRWAQEVGKIFARLKELDDAERRAMGFTPIQNLELQKFTMLGKEREGYYTPMRWHSQFEHAYTKEGNVVNRPSPEQQMAINGLFNEHYVGPALARRWDNERTEYARPTDLTVTEIWSHMVKMARAIAYQGPVQAASQIMLKPWFKTEMAARFGPEWRNLLEPYLKDIANDANVSTKNMAAGNRLIEALRQSFIIYEIGFNIHTFLLHSGSLALNSLQEVSTLQFLRKSGRLATQKVLGKDVFKHVMNFFGKDPTIADRNWKFFMENSYEGRRRLRGHYERFGFGNITHEEIAQKPFHQVVNDFAHRRDWPAAKAVAAAAQRGAMWASTRHMAIADVASTGPLWMAAYERAAKMLEEEGVPTNEQHEIAVDMAEAAVRRAHGTTAETAMPEAIRNLGTAGRYFFGFYQVFNHFLQRLAFEVPYRLADQAGLRFAGKLKEADRTWSNANDTFWIMINNGVIIIAWALLVSGKMYDDKKTWSDLVTSGMAELVFGMFPGLRNLAYFVDTGNAKDVIGSQIETIGAPIRDFTQHGMGAIDEAHLKKTVIHTLQSIGALGGMPSAQMVKILQLIQAIREGDEHPALFANPFAPGSVGYGVLHGTSLSHEEHRKLEARKTRRIKKEMRDREWERQ